MRAKVLFLGSGGSLGVPVIGCRCRVCRSPSVFNKRLRPSVLLTFEAKNFLIDVGPDFRIQALRAGIDHLDGLLLTHAHYDHIAGIDELRIFFFQEKKPLPCLLSSETLEELKTRYYYLMLSDKKKGSSEKRFEFHPLKKDVGTTLFEGLKVTYFSYSQLGMKVTGFRLNTFAYVTDIMEYKESIFHSLQGVETLVISGRHVESSCSHLTLLEAIAFAKKVGTKKTYFTHIPHDMDHEEDNRQLPENMELAFDGMELAIEVEI